jgi:hypothetical protein
MASLVFLKFPARPEIRWAMATRPCPRPIPLEGKKGAGDHA